VYCPLRRQDGFVSYKYARPVVKLTYHTYSMLLKMYVYKVLCQYRLYKTNYAYLTYLQMTKSESYVTTDGQSASLFGIKHPSGAYDQIFITVRQLRVSWCGVVSLTRRRVLRLRLLLVLASAVILGPESRGARDHILLPQI
jgi:hypothetical protein